MAPPSPAHNTFKLVKHSVPWRTFKQSVKLPHKKGPPAVPPEATSSFDSFRADLPITAPSDSPLRYIYNASSIRQSVRMLTLTDLPITAPSDSLLGTQSTLPSPDRDKRETRSLRSVGLGLERHQPLSIPNFPPSNFPTYAPSQPSVVRKSTTEVTRTIDMKRFSVALHMQNLFAWRQEDDDSTTLLLSESPSDTEADNYPIIIEIDSRKRLQNLSISGSYVTGLNKVDNLSTLNVFFLLFSRSSSLNSFSLFLSLSHTHTANIHTHNTNTHTGIDSLFAYM